MSHFPTIATRFSVVRHVIISRMSTHEHEIEVYLSSLHRWPNGDYGRTIVTIRWKVRIKVKCHRGINQCNRASDEINEVRSNGRKVRTNGMKERSNGRKVRSSGTRIRSNRMQITPQNSRDRKACGKRRKTLKSCCYIQTFPTSFFVCVMKKLLIFFRSYMNLEGSNMKFL